MRTLNNYPPTAHSLSMKKRMHILSQSVFRGTHNVFILNSGALSQ